MLLEQIQQTNDIKKINPKDYPLLAEEIRQFLIEKISVTGGHLGSNLGAVELTMAMHIALNLPEDKIVWDVGHQSYTHKLLTGRREGFDHLRKYGGMSGFPKRKESDCDSFDTGHSSTSISAGLGLVRARDIQGKTNTVVSVIGDGALTGGMAYEALNNAARMETNFIIILNDNNMSISENVGGVSKYLNNIRTSNAYLDIKDNIYDALRNTRYGDGVVTGVRRAKNSLKQLVIPGMWFEDMGITYLGPVDGHDVNGLVRVIREAKRRKNCVLIHVLTQKGKGYAPAEKHPARFHGAEPFDVATGVPVIFAIDRAGLVGSDGETHQGIFDLSFLSSIPNMHIMAPKNKWELSDMMKFAYDFKGPIAIRYPRGEAYDGLADKRADVEMGKSEMLFEEEKIALFAVGSMVKTAVEVREALKEKGISCTVVNARFVKPIDENMVRYLAKNHDLIVPMEENVASGGLSEKVITLVEQEKLPIEVLPITIPDEYVEHGNVDILKQEIGISTSAVLEKIEKELEAK